MPPYKYASRSCACALGAQVGAGDPEMGSDAWLMVEALCGAPTERYLPGVRRLGPACWRSRAGGSSASGGHRNLQRALAEAVTALLADEPRLLAAAQAFLGTLVARVVVTLAEAYQSVRLRQTTDSVSAPVAASRGSMALQRINAAANSTLDLDQTLPRGESQSRPRWRQTFVPSISSTTSRASSSCARRAAPIANGPALDAEARPGLLGLGGGTRPSPHHHRRSRRSPLRSGGGRLRHAVPRAALGAIIFFTVLQLQGVISVQSHEGRTYFSEDEVPFSKSSPASSHEHRERQDPRANR